MNISKIISMFDDHPGIGIIIALGVSIIWPVLYYGLIIPLYKKLQRPKLVAKVLETYGALSEKGSLYLFNISVLNIGKRVFYPKNWNAKIKYANEKKIHDAIVVLERHLEMPIKNIRDNIYIQKRLKIENIKYIQNYPILQPQKLICGYIAIEVPSEKGDKNIDQLVFELNDFKGSKRHITIDFKSIKSNELFHDDSIWEPIK